jgi:HAD superfamily hydrolase (TIGR01509 family)
MPSVQSGELLVIFDCDGVLVDSEPVTADVSATILTGLGWKLSAAEVLQKFMGCTDQYWRDQVHAHTGRHIDETWDAEFGSLYEQALSTELVEVAGIRQVLEWLPWPHCVASNGSHSKIRTNLRRVGLDHLFGEAIFSADDVSAGKPAPDLFLHAARSMGFDPKDCVVVEDSVHGIHAARAAGMRSFAYATDLIDPRLLEGATTILFSSMKELAPLLHGSVDTDSRPPDRSPALSAPRPDGSRRVTPIH